MKRNFFNADKLPRLSYLMRVVVFDLVKQKEKKAV